MQLTWRLGTRWWDRPIPDLQSSCSHKKHVWTACPTVWSNFLRMVLHCPLMKFCVVIYIIATNLLRYVIPKATGCVLKRVPNGSGADQWKYQSSASLTFVRGIHRSQRASNAENVSIWWRHHDMYCFLPQVPWTPFTSPCGRFILMAWAILKCMLVFSRCLRCIHLIQ